MSIIVAHLADYPTHLSTVAGWIYHQWGQRPGNTAEATAERLRSHTTRNGIPFMLLALDGSACVGCACLRATDLPGRDDIGPWLASVYVPEDRRGEGIGAKLVRAIETAAVRLGYPELYLFTPDRQRFYAHLGWMPVEQFLRDGAPVTVMRTALRAGLAGTPPLGRGRI